MTTARRYVHVVEPACPFCGGPLGRSQHTDTRSNGRRVQHKNCRSCGERVYVVVERVFQELEKRD